MSDALKYINAVDTFDALNAVFMLIYRRAKKKDKIHLIYDYIEYTIADRPHSLDVVRALPREFMAATRTIRCSENEMIYLTSPSSHKVPGLSTRNIACPKYSREVLTGALDMSLARTKKFKVSPRKLALYSDLSTIDVSEIISLVTEGDESKREYYINRLSANHHNTLDIVFSNPEIAWNWRELFRNPGIDPARLVGLRGSLEAWKIPNIARLLSANPSLTAETVDSTDIDWEFSAMVVYMYPKEQDKLCAMGPRYREFSDLVSNLFRYDLTRVEMAIVESLLVDLGIPWSLTRGVSKYACCEE